MRWWYCFCRAFCWFLITRSSLSWDVLYSTKASQWDSNLTNALALKFGVAFFKINFLYNVFFQLWNNVAIFFIIQSLTSSFKASSACNVKCWVISLQARFLSRSDTKLTLGADIFCFHSRALTGILSLTMNPHWLTYVWACGPNGLPVSVSNSDIMKRPSNGFFGPRTFLLLSVVDVDPETGYMSRNTTINNKYTYACIYKRW